MNYDEVDDHDEDEYDDEDYEDDDDYDDRILRIMRSIGNMSSIHLNEKRFEMF